MQVWAKPQTPKNIQHMQVTLNKNDTQCMCDLAVYHS